MRSPRSSRTLYPIRRWPGACFRNRNPAVIGAPIAVLAFDLFRLKLSAPSRVHDLKRRALVGAPGQPEDFAGAERTERGDEKDGAVAGRPKTGQQFDIPLYRQNRFFAFLDLRDHGLARHVAFENILVEGFGEGRLMRSRTW